MWPLLSKLSNVVPNILVVKEEKVDQTKIEIIESKVKEPEEKKEKNEVAQKDVFDEGDWDDPEVLPSYAVHYSMQFVGEFYKKLQMPQYKWSYSRWLFLISLNKIPTDDIRTYIISLQSKNAKHLSPSLRKQIEKFANDVSTYQHDK